MATFTGRSTPPDPQDSFLGADGVADVFRFTPLTLEAADTVVGGDGAVVDTLQFTAGGAVSAGRFGGVRGIERVQHHASGNSYALTEALVAGAIGGFEVRGGAGADFVDGSALSSALLRVSFVSGGGADTLIGGAGNDSFNVLAAGGAPRLFGGGGGADLVITNAAAWAATDNFVGGDGTDRLLLNAAGSATAAQLAGLFSVEEIQIGNALSFTLALSEALVVQAGGVLKVVGGAGGAQLVDASAVATGGVTYAAGTGADSFIGGGGDDRFEVSEAIATGQLNDGDDVLRLLSRSATGIVVDGGDGHDLIELFASGVWDLTGLSNFEEIELLAASTLSLPGTPGFRVMGSAARDIITLGGPNQVVFGFAGDDVVTLTAASLVGAVLHGGTQAGADTLRLGAAGTYDFRRAAITGFEKLEQVAAPGGGGFNIFLPNHAMDVVLRHMTALTMGAHASQTVAGSVRSDVIQLGAAGQFVDAGNGDDIIAATPLMLAPGTVVAGGLGFDLLSISGQQAGDVVDLRGGAVVLGMEMIQALGGAGLALTLDAAPNMHVVMGNGADTLTGGGGGLNGHLGGGDDILRIGANHVGTGTVLTMDGSVGTDTLLVLEDPATPFAFTIAARFIGFEVVDLSGLSSHSVTFEGAEARRVLLGAAPLSVFGSAGAEEFVSALGLNFISAGDGADRMRQLVAPHPGQTLSGGGGIDVISLELDGASNITAMPTGWVAETVRLVGNHSFTATTQSGLVVIGDPSLGNSITLRGNGQRAEGGSGSDTLRSLAGFNTTLAGGNGEDVYLTSTAEQSLWDTPGQTITDTTQFGELNVLRVSGTGTLTIDFAEHAVTFVDAVEVAGSGTQVNLTLTNALVSTADGNNGGASGDFAITATAAVTAGAVINAGGLTGSNSIRFLGTFNGADTVTGGAAHDNIAAAGGNDLLVGAGGNDLIQGQDGADTIIGGEANDRATGGAGGDRIDLAEGVSSIDRVIYTSASDGTVDINDSVSDSIGTADSVVNFNPAADRIALDRTAMGLGAGGITAVAANGAWNIGTGSVFLFESDSGNSDTLNSNNFADMAAIAFAVNIDNAAGFGSSAGRTVALLVSNSETQPVRQTGLYVWTDTDGDSVLESGDTVLLLAVLQGVTANQLLAGSAIELL